MVDTVIVALPREDDRVHKISSQKAPHLTLMYLGEEFDMNQLEPVVRYIKHIAETSLHRFGLSVDRRGPLGEKNADVIFFEDGWATREIKQTIGYLLADDNISNAYNAQPKKFDKWVPHLTLGYPDAPAKKLKDDDDGRVYYVDFDRIAIWTGDSEGPEFRLKNYEYADEIGHSDATELGNSFSDYFFNEAVLEHYGIKGMQWGKRRADGPDGTVSSAAAKAPKERGKIRRAITKSNTAGKAANEVIDEGHSKLIFLPQAKRDEVAAATKGAALGAAMQVNKSPQFKGKDLKRDPELKAAYHNEIKKAMKIVYKDALDQARVEASVDAVNAVLDARRQRIEMQANQPIRHADESKGGGAQIALEYDEDELGQIKSIRLATVAHAETMDDVYSALESHNLSDNFKIVVDEELAHSDAFVEFVLGEDFEALMHYGVKGMQWGVRKAGRVPTGVALTTKAGSRVKAKGGKFEEPHEDAKKAAILKQKAKGSSTDSLSNTEMKQMIERMQLEANYDRLVQQQRGNDIVKKLFTDPKYRTRQVETISTMTMPVRKGAGAVNAARQVGNDIKKMKL